MCSRRLDRLRTRDLQNSAKCSKYAVTLDLSQRRSGNIHGGEFYLRITDQKFNPLDSKDMKDGDSTLRTDTFTRKGLFRCSCRHLSIIRDWHDLRARSTLARGADPTVERQHFDIGTSNFAVSVLVLD